jgi:hypothetical protein
LALKAFFILLIRSVLFAVDEDNVVLVAVAGPVALVAALVLVGMLLMEEPWELAATIPTKRKPVNRTAGTAAALYQRFDITRIVLRSLDSKATVLYFWVVAGILEKFE